MPVRGASRLEEPFHEELRREPAPAVAASDPATVAGQLLALQRSAGNAAVARALSGSRPVAPTRAVLSRLRREPGAGVAPVRVTSDSGGIASVAPQELYATPALIGQASVDLANRGSYIVLMPGAPCAFNPALARVNVQPAPGVAKGRTQQLLQDVNAADVDARRQARTTDEFNQERKPWSQDVNAARLALDEQVTKTLPDYATFSDCHRNTQAAMGSEDESPIYADLQNPRQQLKTLPPTETRVFATGKNDPAVRGAFMWLAKALPEFPAHVDDALRRIDSQNAGALAVAAGIRGSIISQMSIADPRTKDQALANADYPQQLWRWYRAIQENWITSDVLALVYGVNAGLNVRVGDGIAVINDVYEKAQADVEVDKARTAQTAAETWEDLSDARAAEERATKWNFHWLPVVMTDGDDYVVLENAAGDISNVNFMDTYRWRFKIFGPELSVHEASRSDTHSTEHYLTLGFERTATPAAPVGAAPAQLVPLSADELADLKDNATNQMTVGKYIRRLRQLNPHLTQADARTKIAEMAQ